MVMDSSSTTVPLGSSSIVTIKYPRSSGYKRMLFTARTTAQMRKAAVIAPATIAMIRFRIRSILSKADVPVFSTQVAAISSGVPKCAVISS